MKVPGVLLSGILLSVLLGPVVAVPRITEVDPATTGPNVVQARGPHRLILDSQVEANGLLLVTLGGTNSLPSDLAAFGDLAASRGYKVVALDYPNTVISTKARDDGFPDGFTSFREEIVVGTQVSSIVEVDAANSIENRLLSVLRSAGPGYAEFLENDQPRWNQIVVVGHSQGAGHAAYLGKRHPLRAVVLLAGPQDTSERGVSPWLSMPSQTPPESFLALLHRDDFFDCSKQLQAVSVLRKEPAERFGEDVVVLNTRVKDAHMSVIATDSQPWWEALLQRIAGLSVQERDALVEALRRDSQAYYRHPWATGSSFGMQDYAIVSDSGRTWALTRSATRGPQLYSVWVLEGDQWRRVFDYQNFQQLEGTDLVWSRRMDDLYKLWGLTPELRRRLEDDKARKSFSSAGS